MTDRDQLELAIAAQEQLRGVVDDELIDLAVAALRASLSTVERANRRRRQATVLFADLQGFTALAESLDAEIVHDIMNQLWATLDGILIEHGGRIDKHIGDAVMAVWGAESSGEDDPERALRAALDLQREVLVRAQETGRHLTMRVGVSTGPVLLGSVGTTNEFTAMGDAVNVAARLESAAPLGGVLISHDTYRHVRGVFDVIPQPPLHVKGKTEPLRVYVVLAAKPTAFRLPTRGVEGIETRMVGRERELDALRSSFEEVCSGGPAVVTVVGEPGVGKSRMLYEFENWIELLTTRVYYFKARALATAQTVPYGLMRDLLAMRFGIAERDEPTDVVAKLHAGFGPHLEPEQAEQVGQWLGFDLAASGAAKRWSGVPSASVGAAHLVHYLRALAARDPTLIVLEDLHWADEESLDLLEELVARLSSTHLLVVGATRPVLLERRPSWLAGTVGATTLHLAPLSGEASRALVVEVLQKLTAVPDGLRDLIVDRADGNPFFVEELVKMLIEDGVILPDPDGGTWRVDLDHLDPAAIPSTLTGVLEARLDGLGSTERHALQRASVIGRVFWDAGVAALAPTVPLAETSDALATASQRELVHRSARSSLGSSHQYVFRHALLRDVTYETVLLRDRRRLHALAAEWLIANAGDRLAEFLERIADQHRLAGNLADAADLYRRSGERALAAGNPATTRRSLDRAIALLVESGQDVPIDVNLGLAEACCRIGDLDAADRALAEAMAGPMTPSQEVEALYVGSWVASSRGDRDRERDLLVRAAPLAERIGGVVERRVLNGRAWYEAIEGRFERAAELGEHARHLADTANDSVQLVAALNLLCMVTWELGQLDEAMDYAQRALAIARASGELDAEARSLGNIGVLYHLRADASTSRSDYGEAARFYGAQVTISKRLGLTAPTAWATANVAQVSLRLGDEAAAREQLASATDALLGCDGELLFCLIVGAELRFARGNVAGALVLLGAVRSDPSTTAVSREEIDRVLARFGLDRAVVAEGMRAGEGQDLRQLATELVAELGRAERTPLA